MSRIVPFVLVLTVLVTPSALAQSAFPKTIPLPNGWQPEGIAIGNGTTFYVGSIPTGAIYRGDVRTGEGDVLVPGAAGRAATGLQFHHGLLFVSGAGTGKAFVYDADTGALIREYQLATGPAATFVNDAVVTRDAAYFTDSNRAVIYRITLSKNGVPAAVAETIPLTGDFQLVGGFNLNGIDATPNGKTLVAVQSMTGKLFTIEPTTGVTAEIDLGGSTLPNGDGILLHGRTLYVVQNRLNQIAVVRLSPDFTQGTVTGLITDPAFRVPTTIDRFGNALYAVNARFGTPPTPQTTYDVVRVER